MNFPNADRRSSFLFIAASIGVLLALALTPAAARAQTPMTSVTPSLPADVFAGESFCFTASLSNSGPPGFGPYLLVVLPPGVSFDSAAALGGGSGSVIGTLDPAGMINDPISGSAITGPPGGSLVLVTIPVGSVVAGGPLLEVEVCATLDPDVTIGAPLDITVLPGYELGDTATGDNGSILGAPVTGQVTPVLALAQKAQTAPEGERPPGASWPFEYVLSLDVANGSTVDNVTLEDVLPPEIQWTGGAITANPAGCTVTDPSAPPTPGGTVTVDCGSVTGALGGPEVEIRIPVFATDLLDETSCDTATLTNAASVDFDFAGAAQPTQTVDDGGVLITHAAVQKRAAPAALSPGETVTYTLDFQVTDFDSATDFVLTDVLPDGTTFSGGGSLTVGGLPVAITPAVVTDSPGPGETTLVWDLGAAAGTLAAGTGATLSYEAVVDQTYSPAGANAGAPVRAGDPLTNAASLTFDLAGGAAGCANGTSATVSVLPVEIRKELVDPVPIPSQFMPGEAVTFRLSMQVPSGDVQGVRFTDFLPLPVFDVADFSAATDAVLAPTDSGDSTPAVSTDAGTNSVIIDWADVTVTPTRAVTLAIDLTLTISDQPFADGLSLTNILQATSSNTPGEVLSATEPVQINVGAPVLTLAKGVSATSGLGALTPPPALPVDSDLTGADAGDTVTFVLTAENLGSEPAFQVTFTDPPVAELTGCTLDSVTDGTGAPIATTGDLASGLLLGSPLAANDANPAGGGAPYSADTALVTLTCTLASAVQPGQSIVNTADVVWAPTATSTGFFPPLEDTASATVAQPAVAKRITGVVPGYQAAAPFTNNEPVHIGEVVEYTVTVEVPEGVSSNVVLFDQVDQGLGIVAVDSITAGAGLSTDAAGGFPGVAASALIGAAGGAAVNQDRRLTLNFGTVTSLADNDAGNQTLTVVYRAAVLNSTNNNRNDRRNNRADWRYDRAGGGTQQVRVSAPNVRIREAEIAAFKEITPDVGDAGDTLRVTVEIGHTGASNADAFDLTLADALPAGLTFAGGLAVEAGCSAPPTTGPSESSGVISASWLRFDDGETCAIGFDVTLDPGVSAGARLENCAQAEWQSLLSTDQPVATAPSNALSAERTGDPADPGGSANIYRSEDCAAVSIADVAVTKTLSSTSEAHTGSGEVRPGVSDLTIGEELTFELIVVLPEGSTPQLVVTDFLPFAPGTLEATAARVAFTGGQITLPGPASVSLADNQLADGLDDTVVVDFGGPITNAADGSLDDGDRIRVEIDAVVVNAVGNASGDEITNSALVQFGPGLDGGDTLDLDLVEPSLSLSKVGDLAAGEAGDAVIFTLRIEHAPGSTSDAFDVELSDALPPELSFAGFVGSGLGTCTDTPDAGPSEAAGVIAASWSGLPRGAVCEIVFEAILDVSVMPGQTVVNLASLDWRSLDTTTNA
ncbi:MAG: isopeptide-forming domain-containing fimbrial protein, partial [Acidobacteriota bacterium]